MLLAAVLALNPVGLDFVHAAFLAGEQLSENIAQPIVLAALAIMALAGMAGQNAYLQASRPRRNNCLS